MTSLTWNANGFRAPIGHSVSLIHASSVTREIVN